MNPHEASFVRLLEKCLVRVNLGLAATKRAEDEIMLVATRIVSTTDLLAIDAIGNLLR
jgi:hypothetical protein